MKSEDIKTLNSKSDSELQKMHDELKEKLWGLKSDLIKGKVKNISVLREVKKDIARVLGALNRVRA